MKDVKGSLYTLPAAQVDFELSKRATEQLAQSEAKDRQAKQAEAEAARRRRASIRKRRPMSLLEASRRYGVDQPGMNVSDSTVVAAPSTSQSTRRQTRTADRGQRLQPSR